jgi:hypothetical protein
VVVAFDVYSKASAKERADTEHELLNLAGIGDGGVGGDGDGGGSGGGNVGGGRQGGSGGQSQSADGQEAGGGDSPLAKVNSRSSGRQPMDDHTKVGL